VFYSNPQFLAIFLQYWNKACIVHILTSVVTGRHVLSLCSSTGLGVAKCWLSGTSHILISYFLP